MLVAAAPRIAAGDPQTDGLPVADAVVMAALKDRDRLMPHGAAVVDGLNMGLFGPDLTFCGTKLITAGLRFSPEIVETPPTSRQDLLAPKNAGRTTKASPLSSGAEGIHV